MGMNAASLRAIIAQRQNATVKNDAPTKNDTKVNNLTEREKELIKFLEWRYESFNSSIEERFNKFS